MSRGQTQSCWQLFYSNVTELHYYVTNYGTAVKLRPSLNQDAHTNLNITIKTPTNSFLVCQPLGVNQSNTSSKRSTVSQDPFVWLLSVHSKTEDCRALCSAAVPFLFADWVCYSTEKRKVWRKVKQSLQVFGFRAWGGATPFFRQSRERVLSGLYISKAI